MCGGGSCFVTHPCQAQVSAGGCAYSIDPFLAAHLRMPEEPQPVLAHGSPRLVVSATGREQRRYPALTLPLLLFQPLLDAQYQ